MKRKDLIKEEFALDKKRKALERVIEDHEGGSKRLSERDLSVARSQLQITVKDLRNLQREIYGWRFVRDIYEKKEKEGELITLRRRVLQLQTDLLFCQKVLENYGGNLKMQEAELHKLWRHIGSKIGYNPTQEELKQAQERILEVHREAGTARLKMPEIEKELVQAKEALEKSEKAQKKGKSFASEGKFYSSPGEELSERAKDYAEKHDTDFSSAIKAVLVEDPELGEMYVQGRF